MGHSRELPEGNPKAEAMLPIMSEKAMNVMICINGLLLMSVNIVPVIATIALHSADKRDMDIISRFSINHDS